MLIAINNDIPSRLISIHPVVELISIELDVSPKLVIICLYIPPTSSDSYQQEVLECINSLPPNNPTILLGDFNAPDINWSTLNSTSSYSHSLCNLLYSRNYIQLVTNPTHRHGNTLDLILTNIPHRIQNLSVDDKLCSSFSDHFLISANIVNFTRKICPIRNTGFRYLYSKADFTSMELFLESTTSSISAYAENIEFTWSKLKNILTVGCNQFVPKLTMPRKPSPKWFNSNIRHLLNCAHTLRKLYKKKPTLNNHAKLLQMEDTLQSTIRTSKEEFLQNIVSTFQSNPKQLYNYLKQLYNPKSKPRFIVHDGIAIHDQAKQAEVFNHYFNSTFTSTSQFTLPQISELPTPSSQLSSIEISRSDVFEALIHLDTRKAAGCDSIPSIILKTCAISLMEPVFHLFSLCLRTSSIPQEWKLHKISPIPKKGDQSEVSNYRPISLLCILSKVLESIIYNKIISFVEPLLSRNQFGFLRNRSCLSQLLTSLALVYEAIDNRQQSDILYLDFKKAFNSVPHQELLFKLWQLGITGPLWLWFQSYLSSRRHFVCLDGIKSSSLPVLSGVPQGSIMGPLLFLIYINDLPTSIHHSLCYLFADDTKLIKAISSFNDCLLLQEDISSVQAWCQKWNLPLNIRKCNALRFASKLNQDSFQYLLDDTKIQLSKVQRDLGILVKDDLSWSDHYNHICSKAYRSLNLIRRSVTSSTPMKTKKQLYISLVRCHLCYCSQIWRPCLIKDIVNLERVQRKATKFILNDYTCNYKSRLDCLHMLPLTLWFELQDVMFLIKCLQDPSDSIGISKYVKFASSNTRAKTLNKLTHNITRTSKGRNFYFSRVVRLWNSLPSHLTDLTLSFTSLKLRIQDFFWNHFQKFFNLDNIHSFHFLCPCSQCFLS